MTGGLARITHYLTFLIWRFEGVLMLTPLNYWRITMPVAALDGPPDTPLLLPACLASQQKPPTVGDGLLLADYDPGYQIGLVRVIGIVLRRHGSTVDVDWRLTATNIWVDSPAGRGNWASKQGFRFAATKVAGYGLHHLFAEHFPDLTPRESLPSVATAVRTSRRTGLLPQERTTPVEIIGEASDVPRGGACGRKLGRLSIVHK